MAPKYYWIKERNNPQFKKPYYVAFGNIPQKEALKHEQSLYGYNNMLKFASKDEYEAKLKELEAQGYSVHGPY